MIINYLTIVNTFNGVATKEAGKFVKLVSKMISMAALHCTD